jgi:putative PEP-CTERM system TPR-repeat lipoprotein
LLSVNAIFLAARSASFGLASRAVLLVAMASAAGCSNSAESRQRYFESGNRFFAQGQYEEAAVEFRNALREDDDFGPARYRLAETLAATGNPEGAYREFVRAADLMPDNAEAQLKAATFLFLSGQFEDARSRVRRVLDKDPRNIEAQILFANTLAGLRDFDGAVAETEEAIRIDPGSAAALTNLALIRVAQGEDEAALRAFERAVATDPKSARARLALANYQWSTGVLAQAEESLEAALLIEPSNTLANRGIAALYLATNRAELAEKPLKIVAETVKSPVSQLALADYYIQMKKLDLARTLLAPMVDDPRTFADARTRLALMDFAGGDRARAHAAVDEVLTRLPNHAPTLVVKARLLLADGQPLQALERATQATNAAPREIGPLYLVGTLQALTGRTAEAAKSFNDVLRLNPRAAAAQIQLANLRLSSGEAAPALEFAQNALLAAPRSPEARLAFARSLVAVRDVARAEPEVARLMTDFPTWASVNTLQGTLQLMKGDVAKARVGFEQALKLDRNSVAALTGITMIEAQENKLPSARARLEKILDEGAVQPDLLMLAAKVYVASKDTAKAEAVLKKAIATAPTASEPYMMLADLYSQQGQADGAERAFDASATRDPKDVGSATMAAILAHKRNDLAVAKRRYQTLLALEPRAAVAANNLAWIYADENENLDTALLLAEGAVAQLPNRAEPRNTLGWVYFKKQLPRVALSHFEAAAQQEPDNAMFQYYLGLAYARTGDRLLARRAFETSIKLNAGLQEAKDELARLTKPPDQSR